MVPSTSESHPPVPRHRTSIRLAQATSRHATAVLVAAGIVAVLALVMAAGTMPRLVLSRFESPGSQSSQGAEQLQARVDTGKPPVLPLVTARHRPGDDPPPTPPRE